MNVDVATYNSRNGAQIRDANEVFQLIQQDGVDDIKTILDIGCGSGNVTKLVAETIPHETMFAFDIDPKMVEYARDLNLNERNKIQFFVCDIALPWADLDKNLLDLEGKVDLIWSNRVLHWIPDDLRTQAAKNIVRLLRPGGRLYINTTLTDDPNEALPAEVKAENDKLMKVPSRETQHEWWESYFAAAGLSSLKVDYLDKTWDWGSNEVFRSHLDFFHFWKRYIPEEIPVEQHDDILKKLGDAFLGCMGHPKRTPAVNPIETLSTSYYGQFRIIGVK